MKAPLDQILGFVAWHLNIGASEIWVHLDEPDDASMHILNDIKRVTAIPCDDAYWNGRRPIRQEVRQGHNIQRVYADTSLAFLAHVDVDEFIYSTRPVAEILAEVPANQAFVRMAPAEALNDETLRADIFTARQFRRPFDKSVSQAQKAQVFGEYAPLLPWGILSHRVGKSLFRTGVDGLVPRIHSASTGTSARPLHMPFHPDLTVLHFHAQNRAEWTAAAPVRSVTGAYRFNEPLARFLTTATTEQINQFYVKTQTANPEMVDILRDMGLLVEAELRLKEHVAALF